MLYLTIINGKIMPVLHHNSWKHPRNLVTKLEKQTSTTTMKPKNPNKKNPLTKSKLLAVGTKLALSVGTAIQKALTPVTVFVLQKPPKFSEVQHLYRSSQLCPLLSLKANLTVILHRFLPVSHLSLPVNSCIWWYVELLFNTWMHSRGALVVSIHPAVCLSENIILIPFFSSLFQISFMLLISKPKL